MNCVKCTAPVTVSYKTGGFCDGCFVESFEKRVRQSLWSQQWVRPGDRVLLINDGSIEGQVSERLLRQILGSMPVTVDVRAEEADSTQYQRIIIPTDLDDEVQLRLAGVLHGTEAVTEDVVKFLVGVQDWEVKEYARVKGISSPLEAKTATSPGSISQPARELIHQMEARIPGSKFALLRALDEWDACDPERKKSDS